MSKKEKRGNTLAIIFLLVPLVLFMASFLIRVYQDFYIQTPISTFFMLGVFYAIWTLISYATYLGKRWAQTLLTIFIVGIVIAISIAFQNSHYYDAKSSPVQIALIGTILIYALPTFLLFLPAPNAFLRYQREKGERHLGVLEHQLNQIGKDE